MNQKQMSEPWDLEALMRQKSFLELDGAERDFVLQQVDSEAEYTALRDTLLAIGAAFENEKPVIPAPRIKEELMAAFDAKERKSFVVWLNSLFVFLFPPKELFFRKPGFQVAFGLILLLGTVFYLQQGTEESSLLAEQKTAAPSADGNANEPGQLSNGLGQNAEELFKLDYDKLQDEGNFEWATQETEEADKSEGAYSKAKPFEALGNSKIAANAAPKKLDVVPVEDEEEIESADVFAFNIAVEAPAIEESNASVEEVIAEYEVEAFEEVAAPAEEPVSRSLSNKELNKEVALFDANEQRKDQKYRQELEKQAEEARASESAHRESAERFQLDRAKRAEEERTRMEADEIALEQQTVTDFKAVEKPNAKLKKEEAVDKSPAAIDDQIALGDSVSLGSTNNQLDVTAYYTSPATTMNRAENMELKEVSVQALSTTVSGVTVATEGGTSNGTFIDVDGDVDYYSVTLTEKELKQKRATKTRKLSDNKNTINLFFTAL